MKPGEVNPTRTPATTGIVPGRARLSWWAPPPRVPARMAGFLWGLVFAAGGIAVWIAAPAGKRAPSPWGQVLEAGAGGEGMGSYVRWTEGQPEILRLEWPAHPNARSYRLRFRSLDGAPLPPVTLQNTVFLYDLRRDVLDLPESFEWEVAAVLQDGSEIVAPPRTHPSH